MTKVHLTNVETDGHPNSSANTINLNSNHQETSTKPNWEIVYKITALHSSKMSRSSRGQVAQLAGSSSCIPKDYRSDPQLGCTGGNPFFLSLWNQWTYPWVKIKKKIQVQEKRLNCSGLKKETQQLNTIYDPGLQKLTRQYITLTIYKIWICTVD